MRCKTCSYEVKNICCPVCKDSIDVTYPYKMSAHKLRELMYKRKREESFRDGKRCYDYTARMLDFEEKHRDWTIQQLAEKFNRHFSRIRNNLREHNRPHTNTLRMKAYVKQLERQVNTK